MPPEHDPITKLGDNNILFLIGALNREFGGRENWPTNVAGLDLPDYVELLVNLQVLKKLNARDGDEPVEDTGDEYLDHFIPKASDKRENTDTTRSVRAKRAQSVRKFKEKRQKVSSR